MTFPMKIWLTYVILLDWLPNLESHGDVNGLKSPAHILRRSIRSLVPADPPLPNPPITNHPYSPILRNDKSTTAAFLSLPRQSRTGSVSSFPSPSLTGAPSAPTFHKPEVQNILIVILWKRFLYSTKTFPTVTFWILTVCSLPPFQHASSEGLIPFILSRKCL